MICHNLIAFCDGELSTADADAFRAHLRQCARCAAQLPGSVALSSQLSAPPPSEIINLAHRAANERGEGCDPYIRTLSLLARVALDLLWASDAVEAAAWSDTECGAANARRHAADAQLRRMLGLPSTHGDVPIAPQWRDDSPRIVALPLPTRWHRFKRWWRS